VSDDEFFVHEAFESGVCFQDVPVFLKYVLHWRVAGVVRDGTKERSIFQGERCCGFGLEEKSSALCIGLFSGLEEFVMWVGSVHVVLYENVGFSLVVFIS